MLQAGIEIISAAAVIITLIFLLIGIRQNPKQTKFNTHVVEMAVYQDLIVQISKLNTLRLRPRF